MKRVGVLRLIILISLMFFPVSAMSDHLTADTVRGEAEVVDGDTLRFPDVKGEIQLWGVDAPEIWTDAGRRSKTAMQHIVWAGQPLTCTLTGEGPHGRIVARCLDTYGRDIAKRMIVQGYARPFRSPEETATGDNPFPEAWRAYSWAAARD